MVTVEITTEDNICATAQGVNLLIPFGKIRLSRQLHNLLSNAEIEFVLAHEVAHIYLNHLIGIGSFVLTRALVEDAARDNPKFKWLLPAWDSLKLLIFNGGNLPPFAALTKTQELDADACAVFLTGSKAAARSTLFKLACNNTSLASHTWEVFDTTLPVITIEERLAALDIKFPSK